MKKNYAEFLKAKVTHKRIMSFNLPNIDNMIRMNLINKDLIMEIFSDAKKENKVLTIRKIKILIFYFKKAKEFPKFSIETLRKFLKNELKGSFGRIKTKNNKLNSIFN